MLDFKVNPKKCIKCNHCVTDCPVNIIDFGKKLPFIPKDKEESCIGCQHCLAICPTAAISILQINPLKSTSISNNIPKYEKFKNLVKGRRSIRHYKNENISKENINELLSTALHSPTGANAMNVSFSVIDDKDIMNKYRNEIYDKLKIVVNNNMLPPGLEFFSGMINKWFVEKKDIIFRNAPHMVIASAPKNSTTPTTDTIIALSYFELLASAMGVGTLWCGMANWVIEDIIPEIKIKLGIPEDHIIGEVMLFGKPSVKYYRTVQRKSTNIRIIK